MSDVTNSKRKTAPPRIHPHQNSGEIRTEVSVAERGEKILGPRCKAGQGAVIEGEEGGGQGIGQVVVHDEHRQVEPVGGLRLLVMSKVFFGIILLPQVTSHCPAANIAIAEHSATHLFISIAA